MMMFWVLSVITKTQDPTPKTKNSAQDIFCLLERLNEANYPRTL